MNASETWAVFITVLNAWSFWRIGVLEGRVSYMRKEMKQSIVELDKAIEEIHAAAKLCHLPENNSNT